MTKKMTKDILTRAGIFFVILSLCMAAAKPVSASNKAAYYSFMIIRQSEYNNYSDSYSGGLVYYARIKNNKLILKGKLGKYSSKNSMLNRKQMQMTGLKKRIYKITKNTKYYTTEHESVGKMDEGCRVSKQNFKQLLKEMSGMGVDMKVKNGKVIYMEMHN